MHKQVIDLSKRTPEEIHDFLQVLMFVRQKLSKSGFALHVKKSRTRKVKRKSK